MNKEEIKQEPNDGLIARILGGNVLEMRIYERKNILERNINYSNAYGRNLLQEAIVSCENAIAIDLVNKGIDINHQDKMGWTPLHFCAQYNNITIAELLLQEGANVNIIDCYGNNPLWYAVFNANDDYCLVKLLVKYGADALSKNNAMRSPLDFAKQIEDTEMINILANKNLISKYQSKK